MGTIYTYFAFRRDTIIRLWTVGQLPEAWDFSSKSDAVAYYHARQFNFYIVQIVLWIHLYWKPFLTLGVVKSAGAIMSRFAPVCLSILCLSATRPSVLVDFLCISLLIPPGVLAAITLLERNPWICRLPFRAEARTIDWKLPKCRIVLTGTAAIEQSCRRRQSIRLDWWWETSQNISNYHINTSKDVDEAL